MIREIVFWVLIISLVLAGGLKLYNPIQFVPSQSFIPVTSEIILFITALPLAIVELTLATVLCIYRDSGKTKLICAALFSLFFIWSLVSLIMNVQVPDACLEQMASRQNLTQLTSKNFLLLSGAVLLLSNKKAKT